MADTSGDRLGNVERQIFLRSLAFARPAPSAARQLATAMTDVVLDAGAPLYREGEASDVIYFVVRGTVELVKEGQETWTFQDQSVLGMLDALPDRPRTRTAIARTEVYALALPAEEWFDVLEDHFEYARTAMLGAAGNLHRMRLSLAPDGGFPALPPPRAGHGLIDPHRPLNPVERMLVLRELAPFRAVNIQAIVSLAAFGDEIALDAGQTLHQSGELDGTFHVVARGRLRLERADPPITAEFGGPALLGGGAAFGPWDEEYTATAVTPALVLRFAEESFYDVLEDHFDMIRAITAAISAEREAVMNERVRRGLGASVPRPTLPPTSSGSESSGKSIPPP